MNPDFQEEARMNISNVGGTDKLIRIVAGAGLLSLFFLLQGDAR